MGAKQKAEDVRIVVLQRGWVMVGRFEQQGAQCQLHGASVIRRWGTKKGLGELATDGPLANTLLDPAGEVKFHELTVIATFACEVSKWAPHVK
jgi:hypothetical protein